MGQLVDEIKPQYDSKMNFLVVYVDDEKEQPVADSYNLQYVPTTYLYNAKGKETNNHAGVVSKDTLIKELDDLVK